MKTKHLLISVTVAVFIGCASPEDRANEQIDTTTVKIEDTTGTDTTTNVNGRSGNNGTGTDTTNSVEQKAIREAGNN